MNVCIYIRELISKLNTYNNGRYESVEKQCWTGCQIFRDSKVIMIFDYSIHDIHTTNHISKNELKTLKNFVHNFLPEFHINGYYTIPAMVKGSLYDYDHTTHEPLKVFDLRKETIKLSNYFAKQGYTVSSAKKVAKDYLDKADSQKVTKLEDD